MNTRAFVRSCWRPLVLACAIVLLQTVAPATGAPRVAPELAAQANLAGPEELIPIIIVMQEQLDPRPLLPTVSSLPSPERRSFARAELRENADRTQAPVRSYLSVQETEGQASNVRPLWIANGILADVTSTALDGLLDYPEIRVILWDPLIPEEEAHDLGESLPDATPPDPRGLRAEIWQLENINAPDAWALGLEGQGIVVAVEDNGVDRTHPDLATHIWNNDNEIPGNLVDDDMNGYVDDTWGWDFVSNDNSPMPAGDDHGTKCAGIVAGDGTNGTRTGVAPQALIMGCRVSSWGQNIEGIQYAIDNGAHVITMSRSQKWRFVPKPDYDWWRSITDGELLTGIFHANSIGNEGDNQGTDPIPFNIAAPGCCPTPWRHPDQVQAGVSGITSGCGAIDVNNVLAGYSSIGPFAWEDIQAHWPEYTFPMRPEYQDYPWWGGQPGLLKPDVVAPGPGTLSIAIGGGYGSFGGTSAATPHVAGAIALILSANPFLTPEEMTMVLQSTAFDLGQAGKDVRYGAGRLDCLAAVQLAQLMNNFGLVQGTVTDQSSGTPIDDVLVAAAGAGLSTRTDATGAYSLGLPGGTWTLNFTNFYYQDGQAQVTVNPQETVVVDLELNSLPTSVVQGRVAELGTGTPIADATIEILDSPIPTVQSDGGGNFAIPGVPVGARVVTAEKFGWAPGGALFEVMVDESPPAKLSLAPSLVALDMESDPFWQAGVPGDNATTGIWVRVDPNGTAAQPEDDHTPDPGTQCWVTGQGTPGGTLGENDVDGGQTTLRTSVLDLASASDPVVSYWGWYSNNQGSVIDDEWVVQISSDGGSSWVDVVRSSTPTNGWEQFTHRVTDFVAATDMVVLQFVASDLGGGSIVEAAIDDFQVWGAPPATDARPVEIAVAGRLVLEQNYPNPVRTGTTIRFSLPLAADVELRIYDVSGRLVRQLVPSERRDAGSYTVPWDATDGSGERVASGVYFYRLEGRAGSATRRLVVLR